MQNREGNLGFGYRQIAPQFNSVLGANAWIDRRRTEHGSNFHQLTLGVESLGNKVDLRANAYIQLNSAKTTITPNIGSTTPYLAGSGIFIDTNGSIVEEAQDGFDAEIGYRLPILQKYIDTTRIYAGGYHFWGDTTDNVTGFRLRTEAQVNSIFSIGARFQHDGPRGSQGFLEATLRFPFKSKKLFQQDGLKSRLDESPERDIDIVTGAKVDTGLMKPVLNASGTQQRILYVDNTNTQSGDGTKDNPFNTLAAAQAALQANDILYINRGDGTTTGMNQGIVIDKANVQLIGSGSALTYAGYTLLNAGLAPVITNTAIPVDSLDIYTGNGVLVTGDNSFISGMIVNGSRNSGISVLSNSNTINQININNVDLNSNIGRGIFVNALNSGYIGNINILNSTVSNNTDRGIYVVANTQGRIQTVIVENNNSIGNTTSAGRGIQVEAAGNDSTIGSITMLKNNAGNNGAMGMYVLAYNGGHINSAFLTENTSNNNTGTVGRGIQVESSGTGSLISNVQLLKNTTTNNAQQGQYIAALGTSSSITNLTISDNISNNNTGSSGRGIHVETSGTTNFINTLQISNNIASNNSNAGIYTAILGANNYISTINISANTSSNNTNRGIYALVTTGGYVTTLNIQSNTSNNNITSGGRGIQLEVNDSTSYIGNATISQNTTNNNQSVGLFASASNSGRINSVTFSNNSSTGNGAQGIYLGSIGTGTSELTTVLSNNYLANNIQQGIYIYAPNSNNISSSFINNTITANISHGIYFDDDTSGTFIADMGGGGLSTGGNRIFGNAGTDIRVDLDGAELKAENNWWGVNTGLNQGTRVTLEVGSTVDATPYLTVDPGI